MKQKLTEIKREIENPTIIVGDFVTILSGTNKTIRRKSVKT